MRPQAALISFLILAAGAVTAGAATASPTPAPPRYSAKRLPNVNDDCTVDAAARRRPRAPVPASLTQDHIASSGAAVNAGGQVAGSSYYCVDDGSYEAVTWDRGSLIELNPPWGLVYPVGWEQSAFGINDHGAVVGAGSIAGESGRHAFLYRDGSMSDLGTLSSPGPCDWLQQACAESLSVATAVNSQGQVVGASDWSPDVSGQHAFLFTAGQLQDLGTLGGLTSWATAINGNGNVVGFADTLDGQSHGFVWNGSMQDVGTLGGASSAATGINSSGRIVGYSDTGGGNRHAFIRVTILRDLGTLGGSTSAATGVNDRGTVVGESTVPGDTEMHAFVVVNGVMRDLNAMVPPGTPTLECAAAINGSGVIVANTTPCPLGTSFANITTSEQAYVLTPLG